MNTTDLDKKKMLPETMLAKIEDVLKHGKKSDPPAYTLILGAGASFGVVPTAKEMLGFPDSVTKKFMKRVFLSGWPGSSIPMWHSMMTRPGLNAPPHSGNVFARKIH
jgi:hypothetical protein